ncbi:MAG: 30S ribosome-binding factor RbfA [Candidatus Muiribacterium halophilum]|uniref:Ribosome-binding factor A n=1 Tax=Muiribacterium halophilum TaxID=2053465 RepID=A0A2N5ZK00_MUIH1|nr:MAG: 30S ribosome-binding factor RbfA [Candidatus Muirbacterium halophilum]
MAKSHRRIKRVNSMIQNMLCNILTRHVEDERFRFITITAVETTNDLRMAKVFYTVYGKKEEEKKDLIKTLEKASGFLQKKLSEEIELRYTPKLIFEYDHTLERAAKLDELFKRIEDERKNKES